MMISTLRLPDKLSLNLCVNGALIDVYVETEDGTHVTTAFTYFMGSPIELRRSIHGVNVVQPENYPNQIVQVNLSEEIRYGLMVIEDRNKNYRTTLRPLSTTDW